MPTGTPNKKDSVWDDIKEFPLKLEEIEDLFENKKKDVVASSGDGGKVVNVVKKKTYFDPSAAQNILITLNKLPPPPALLEACTSLDEKLISPDQINALLRIFPAQDVVDGLIEEAKNTPEDEKWDKGEEYFLQVVGMKSLKQRLVVWQFKMDFPEKKESVISVQKNFELAFDELKTSKNLKKIFGFILALGNILNGGTQKGQADGFYLEALSKTTTMRDANNRTIMQLICEKMKQEDEDFVNIKNDFKHAYIVAQYNLKDEDTKLKEIKGNFDKAKGNFDVVERALGGTAPDAYCVKIKEFLVQTQRQMEEMEKKLEGLFGTYKSSCEFFLIDKGDEKSQSSQEFFKFFTQFIDSVLKSMPKEEKKRTAAKKPAEGAAGGKKFGQMAAGASPDKAAATNSLMNELKMKQAQKPPG